MCPHRHLLLPGYHGDVLILQCVCSGDCTFMEIIKVKQVIREGWPSHFNWSPYQKTTGTRDLFRCKGAQRKGHMQTQWEGVCVKAGRTPSQENGFSDPVIWTCSLQHCGNTAIYCLSHPILWPFVRAVWAEYYAQPKSKFLSKWGPISSPQSVLIFPYLDFHSYVLSSLPTFESSSALFAVLMFFLKDNDYNMCSCLKKKLSKIGKIASHYLEIQILQNSHLEPLSLVHFCPHPQDTSKIAFLMALTNTLSMTKLYSGSSEVASQLILDLGPLLGCIA